MKSFAKGTKKKISKLEKKLRTNSFNNAALSDILGDTYTEENTSSPSVGTVLRIPSDQYNGGGYASEEIDPLETPPKITSTVSDRGSEAFTGIYDERNQSFKRGSKHQTKPESTVSSKTAVQQKNATEEALTDNIRVLQQKNSQLETDCKEWKTQYNILREELVSLQADHNKLLKSQPTPGSIESSKHDMKELQKQNNELQKRNENLQAKIQELQQTNEKLQQSKEKLTLLLQKKATELEDQQKQRNLKGDGDTTGSLRKITAELETSHKKINEQNEEIQKLLEQRLNLETELSDLRLKKDASNTLVPQQHYYSEDNKQTRQPDEFEKDRLLNNLKVTVKERDAVIDELREELNLAHQDIARVTGIVGLVTDQLDDNTKKKKKGWFGGGSKSKSSKSKRDLSIEKIKQQLLAPRDEETPTNVAAVASDSEITQKHVKFSNEQSQLNKEYTPSTTKTRLATHQFMVPVSSDLTGALYQKRLLELERENSKLEGEIDILQREKQHYKDEIDLANSQIDILQKTFEQKEFHLQSFVLSNTVAVPIGQDKENSNNEHHLQAVVQIQDASLRQLSLRNKQLESTLEKYSMRQKDQRSQIKEQIEEQLQSEISRLSTKLTALKQEKDKIELEYNSLLAIHEGAEAEIKRLKASIDELVHNNGQKNAEINKTAKVHATMIGNLLNQNGKLQDKLSELRQMYTKSVVLNQSELRALRANRVETLEGYLPGRSDNTNMSLLNNVVSEQKLEELNNKHYESPNVEINKKKFVEIPQTQKICISNYDEVYTASDKQPRLNAVSPRDSVSVKSESGLSVHNEGSNKDSRKKTNQLSLLSEDISNNMETVPALSPSTQPRAVILSNELSRQEEIQERPPGYYRYEWCGPQKKFLLKRADSIIEPPSTFNTFAQPSKNAFVEQLGGPFPYDESNKYLSDGIIRVSAQDQQFAKEAIEKWIREEEELNRNRTNVPNATGRHQKDSSKPVRNVATQNKLYSPEIITLNETTRKGHSSSGEIIRPCAEKKNFKPSLQETHFEKQKSLFTPPVSESITLIKREVPSNTMQDINNHHDFIYNNSQSQPIKSSSSLDVLTHELSIPLSRNQLFDDEHLTQNERGSNKNQQNVFATNNDFCFIKQNDAPLLQDAQRNAASPDTEMVKRSNSSRNYVSPLTSANTFHLHNNTLSAVNTDDEILIHDLESDRTAAAASHQEPNHHPSLLFNNEKTNSTYNNNTLQNTRLFGLRAKPTERYSLTTEKRKGTLIKRNHTPSQSTELMAK